MDIYQLYYIGQYYMLRDTIFNFYDYLEHITEIGNEKEQEKYLLSKEEEIMNFMVREREGISRIYSFITNGEAENTKSIGIFALLLSHLMHQYHLSMEKKTSAGAVKELIAETFSEYDRRMEQKLLKIHGIDETFLNLRDKKFRLIKVV